jgi:hypothetical protein
LARGNRSDHYEYLEKLTNMGYKATYSDLHPNLEVEFSLNKWVARDVIDGWLDSKEADSGRAV